MSHQATVPAVVARYFGPTDRTTHPVVEQVFQPGRGWVRSPIRKRINPTYARALRRAGVTSVALRSGGRLADFQISEVTR